MILNKKKTFVTRKKLRFIARIRSRDPTKSHRLEKGAWSAGKAKIMQRQMF
jgi:hypothetical protein